MLNRLIILLLIISAFAACTPVRSTSSSTKKSKTTKTATKTEKIGDDKKSKSTAKADEKSLEKIKVKKTPKPRFSDTTYIELATGKPTVSAEEIDDEPSYQELLNSAIEYYDAGKIDEAMPIIESVLSSEDADAPILDEAFYYKAECYISKSEFEPAIKILSEINKRDDVEPTVKERSLVRLGQVYCTNGKTKQAKQLFDTFKKEYPKSQYLKLANCGK